MAGTGVTLYQTTAAGNKAVIGTIDWREDVYMPSQINDNVGQIMADIRALANNIAAGFIEIGDGEGVYTAVYVAANQFQFAGVNVTAYYRVGMRVRVTAPTPGTLTGTITASAFATHTTITVAWDTGQLSNEAITSVQLGVGSGDPGTRINHNVLGRNGGLEVWQRAAGGAAAMTIPASTSTGAYTADGWCLQTGVDQVSGVSQVGGLDPGSRYSAFVQRAAGQTGTGLMIFEYPLDTDEIAPLRGSLVTLSFRAQAGANWSPAGGSLLVFLRVGSGAPAKRLTTAYASETDVIGSSAVLSTAATRFPFPSALVVPVGTTQACVQFLWTPVGTAGSADGFLIDDVKLEIGSVATPFERRPFESELLACRRHYFKTFPYGTAPAVSSAAEESFLISQVVAASTAMDGATLRLPVEMRAAPSVVLFNPGAANAQVRNFTAGADCSGSIGVGTTVGLRAYIGATAVGSGAGHKLGIHMTAEAGI